MSLKHRWRIFSVDGLLFLLWIFLLFPFQFWLEETLQFAKLIHLVINQFIHLADTRLSWLLLSGVFLREYVIALWLDHWRCSIQTFVAFGLLSFKQKCLLVLKFDKLRWLSAVGVSAHFDLELCGVALVGLIIALKFWAWNQPSDYSVRWAIVILNSYFRLFYYNRVCRLIKSKLSSTLTAVDHIFHVRSWHIVSTTILTRLYYSYLITLSKCVLRQPLQILDLPDRGRLNFRTQHRNRLHSLLLLCR